MPRNLSAPLAVLLLSCALATTAGAAEVLAFKVNLNPSEWRAHQSQTKQVRTTEFVRASETFDAWTERITWVTMLKKGSVRDLVNSVRAQMMMECPGMEWTIIRESKTAVLYEWKVAGCRLIPDQHELATFLDGKESRFGVHYTTKRSQLDTEPSRSTWLDVISAARVVDR